MPSLRGSYGRNLRSPCSAPIWQAGRLPHKPAMKADAIVVGQASRLPSGWAIYSKSDEDGRVGIEN